MTQGSDGAAIEGVNGSKLSAARQDGPSDLQRLRVMAMQSPSSPGAWRALGRELRRQGERIGAAAAFARSITASLTDPELIEIEKLVRDAKRAEASQLLLKRLAEDADDIVALRLAGDLEAQTGQAVEAEKHYRQCIDLCPSYVPARYGLTRFLLRQARLGEASNESERMLVTAPTDIGVRTLKAAIAANVGNHEDAAALYLGLVREQPNQPGLWLGLGHSHRTMGRTDEAIGAYRRAIKSTTGAAEAYWSLSNLKTYRFADADLAHMGEAARDAAGQQAAYIHFALGQAYDERGDTERAFENFALGNAAKRATIVYDAEQAEKRQEHWTSSVTAELVAERLGQGDPSPAPIFIVGLPRSGSTLVEQILASHSLIENTAELPYMNRLASRLARRGMEPGRERANLNLDGIDLGALGGEYLAAARAHRKTAKPFFIDKLPDNFAHSGLIKLILPNAKIIDVRRRPVAAVWSVFKQLFAHGQPFAYDLNEIALWYRGYTKAMAHFDAAMPGAILRVGYEDLVDDTEGQIRRVLDHVGVAFEPACLSFYENGNAVRTPSSEQVRQPIFRHAVDSWRRYEKHLGDVERLFATELNDYQPIESG